MSELDKYTTKSLNLYGSSLNGEGGCQDYATGIQLQNARIVNEQWLLDLLNKNRTLLEDVIILRSKMEGLSEENNKLRAELYAVPQPISESIEVCLMWLKAALECENFHWDADQHEAALNELNLAKAWLAKCDK
jgi:hypothetical protein